jgi:hypothetical protein
MSIEIVLTDVTEMHGEACCLAGWDCGRRRMVRPVARKSRWTAEMLRAQGIVQGSRIRVSPSLRAANGAQPHAREDVAVPADGVERVSGPRPAWQGADAPEVAESLARAFDNHLKHAFVKQGVRRLPFVPEGAETRSLTALRLERRAVQLVEAVHKDGTRKLRVVLDDGEARYDLPVVSRALRTAFRDGGVPAVQESLPRHGPMHVRIGLSRGWDAHPGKCFVMLNGILWQGARMITSGRLKLFSIGHSAHPIEAFIDLLAGVGIAAVADVRSAPYSRHLPQFSREALADSLDRAGIAYLYLGRELGGRPSSPTLFTDGIADYERMATAPAFVKGLDWLVDCAAQRCTAMMCAERDPLTCHRCLLVARVLGLRGIGVDHIHADGRVVPHAEAEEELLRLARRESEDLFQTRAERLASAYREWGRKVAFSEAGSQVALTDEGAG